MENWLNAFYLLQLVLAIVGSIYFYVNRKYSFWSNLGVRGPKPTLLRLGNVLQLAGSSEPGVSEIELIRKYGKVYGSYNGLVPVLTITDHELIKQVLAKDFPLFVNRKTQNVHHDTYSNNQFFCKDGNWKRLRSITSPTFTSGKLRGMLPLMHNSVVKLVDFLDKLTSSGPGIMNTREVITGFTIDVIAATSFATETNANDGKTGKSNPLVYNSINFMNISAIRALSILSMPKWFNSLVGIEHYFNVDSSDYLHKLTREMINQRRSTNSGKRNDFLQLLIDAYVFEEDLNKTNYDHLTAGLDAQERQNASQVGSKNRLNDNEIIAQSILYFVAGFETTTSAIMQAIYEMAQNPSVQERLHSELCKALDHLDENSEQYYETVLNGIEYLDAVIKETVRKYPPLPRLERTLQKDGYILNGIKLQQGQLIEISTYGVHYNAEYYPDPHRFNPDRFMSENKHLLVPYTYLAFGSGPRNCVGVRFAYQEIKLCLAQIVRKFAFAPTSETKLRFEPLRITFVANDFETKVTRRK